MFDVRKAGTDLLAKGEKVCLVTVTATKGSTPREAGAAMLVTEDGAVGSIGGGNLEYTAVGKARALLDSDESGPIIFDFILGPDMEQCCGGQVRLSLQIVESIDSLPESLPKTPVIIFGAGHVGQALADVLAPLPFDVMCYDNRREKYDNDKNFGVLPFADIEKTIVQNPANAFYLVMTHDHALDYEIVKTVLANGRFKFLGLIGSKTKKARFVSRLRCDGFRDTQIGRITCPIGIDGIKGKQPEIIAASVAAQLLREISKND